MRYIQIFVGPEGDGVAHLIRKAKVNYRRFQRRATRAGLFVTPQNLAVNEGINELAVRSICDVTFDRAAAVLGRSRIIQAPSGLLLPGGGR